MFLPLLSKGNAGEKQKRSVETLHDHVDNGIDAVDSCGILPGNRDQPQPFPYVKLGKMSCEDQKNGKADDHIHHHLPQNRDQDLGLDQGAGLYREGVGQVPVVADHGLIKIINHKHRSHQITGH